MADFPQKALECNRTDGIYHGCINGIIFSMKAPIAE